MKDMMWYTVSSDVLEYKSDVRDRVRDFSFLVHPSSCQHLWTVCSILPCCVTHPLPIRFFQVCCQPTLLSHVRNVLSLLFLGASSGLWLHDSPPVFIMSPSEVGLPGAAQHACQEVALRVYPAFSIEDQPREECLRSAQGHQCVPKILYSHTTPST